MKMFFIVIFCCVSVFADDTNAVRVVSTVTTNGVSARVTTVDVFTRNGQTNLVRQTQVADGGVHIQLQRFYHDGSLVGEYGAVTNNCAFATGSGSPYRVSFGFGRTGEMMSAVITTKDGTYVDAFSCTNGVFYPADSPSVERLNAYWEAFDAAVVGNFPEKRRDR
jgi:hypothetical protein